MLEDPSLPGSDGSPADRLGAFTYPSATSYASRPAVLVTQLPNETSSTPSNVGSDAASSAVDHLYALLAKHGVPPLINYGTAAEYEIECRKVFNTMHHEDLVNYTVELQVAIASLKIARSFPRDSDESVSSPAVNFSVPEGNLSATSKLARLSALKSASSMRERKECVTTNKLLKEVDDDGLKTINNYVVLHELGRGSCGKVKLAYDSSRGRMVAVKVVRRVDMTAKVGGITEAQQHYQSLQREIAMMKKLRHKHVVSLYEVIDDPRADKLYLVMQYVDGGPLSRVKHDSGGECEAVDPDLLLTYAHHILAGVSYLHNQRVVHRDIKPENVLVSKDQIAFLADFGVAERFKSADAKVQGYSGTPLFMAPEVLALDASVDGFAADMWSVGVTLFAALCGHLPFTSVAAVRAHTLKIPEEHGPVWGKLLSSLLDADPRKRMTALEALSFVKIAEAKMRVRRSSVVEEKSERIEVTVDEVDDAFSALIEQKEDRAEDLDSLREVWDVDSDEAARASQKLRKIFSSRDSRLCSSMTHLSGGDQGQDSSEQEGEYTGTSVDDEDPQVRVQRDPPKHSDSVDPLDSSHVPHVPHQERLLPRPQQLLRNLSVLSVASGNDEEASEVPSDGAGRKAADCSAGDTRGVALPSRSCANAPAGHPQACCRPT
jgi:serine/threonine protein kinase